MKFNKDIKPVKQYIENRWEKEQKTYEIYGYRPAGTEKEVYNSFLRNTLLKLFEVPLAININKVFIKRYLQNKGLPKEILWMFASPDHCSFCFFPFKKNPPLIRACKCQK